MVNYYFLTARLPPLAIGEAPEITFEEFLQLLHDNLSSADQQKIAVIRRYYDLENMRRFWLDEPFDMRGNYDERALEEALLTGEGLPRYVYDFLEKYHQPEDRLHHFPALLTAYFREEIAAAHGFLRELLILERNLRLVLVGFRARQMGRDLASELQYEDPEDPIVGQLLTQRDGKEYEPPAGFEQLKHVFSENADRPLQLYEGLAKFRFNWIEERLTSDLFSMDRVLGYMIQLILVEMHQELDRETGTKIIEKMVKEAS